MIEVESHVDERGAFSRTFDADRFAAQGLEPQIAQASVSVNPAAGTLRGIHYQVAPHEETKLIGCTRGALYVVVVDLRSDSPTYCEWYALELSHENGKALYVPRGAASGFQTLRDETDVSYQISRSYVPSHARGARWDDPAFGIRWPEANRTISERDRLLPDYRR